MLAQTNYPLYREPYRPQFHYTAPYRWLNDPNGLVYHEGEFHLFYQFHPYDSVWGPMHWGHAVSRDLLHWETLPIALYPDEFGTIFSGCVVIDTHNTAGFGANALVALYSYNTQAQGVAYSLDGGQTWTKYEANPIMPPLLKDFRDPKVIWHAPTQRWVMVIAAGKAIHFYTSSNLLHWTLTQPFSIALESGVWEVPDLFPLVLDDHVKWVLIISVGDGAPAGGSGTFYLLGAFDGATFTPDTVEPLWFDYGTDNYACTTWYNAPHEQRLFIGWMSNWRYANITPTSPWRSGMTLPRELRLVHTDAGIRMAQVPVDLRPLHLETLYTAHDQPLQQGTLELPVYGRKLEIVAQLTLTDADRFSIQLHADEHDALTLTLDRAHNRLILRRPSAEIENYPLEFSAPIDLSTSALDLRIVLDESSLEVFAQQGTVVMTAQTFGNPHSDGVRLISEGGITHLNALSIHALDTTWADNIEDIWHFYPAE